MLMFAFGFMLYGTTVLLPEFVQLLMGYTAELAGTILSPGALLIIALMPLVGILIARVDARWVLGFGFLVLSLSLFHMTGIDLQLSWWNAMMLRTYQSIAIAFLFVPINTVTYTGVKPEQNNQVSGLINLMRNIGASTGISLTGAMITERGQFHQAELAHEPPLTVRTCKRQFKTWRDSWPRRVEHARCYPSGVRPYLCRPGGAGADACFHRHVLGDGDRHLVPDSAGLLPGEARAGQGDSSPLAKRLER